jgi:Cu-processing system ATP-binding protein
VELKVEPGQASGVAAALAGIDGVLLDDITGDCLQLRCERSCKLALLSAVAALGAAVVDLQLREPSLEDLFLMKGGAHAASH